MQRGARVLLTVLLLAFVGMGTYYASQAPTPAEAERADLGPREAALPPAAVTIRDDSADGYPGEESAASATAPTPAASEPDAAVIESVPPTQSPPATPQASAVISTASTPLGVIEIGLSGEADLPEGPLPGEHVVAAGETLSSIAAVHLGDSSRWREIAAANPRIDADRLAVGDRLRIPAAAPPSPRQVAGDRDHTVAEGETLSSIAAERLGSAGRWREIYELNRDRLESPNRLRAGQRLRLPS